MTQVKLPFFSEVRVTGALKRKEEFEGYIGAILGVSENTNDDGDYSYAVQLDRYDYVVSFFGSELTPTGSMRDRSDYYP